ncbi:MAG TPA: LysM peptidoglycan-binding domain-containing M23 family metallopeptidase [Aestuariivirgaceae bacterium]
MIGLAGFLLAGCSSSIDRFADYPGKRDRTHTASAPKYSGSASSDDYIESSSLGAAPVRSTSSNPYQPPIYSQTQNYNKPRYQKPQYQQPQYQQSQYQQQYQEPQYEEPQYEDQSESASGSFVVVEPGQTLYSIARANGMTVATLAAANAIHPPYHLRAGQRVRIPGVDEPRAVATYAPAQQNFSQKSSVHIVRSGETLFSLGRKYGLHPYKIADFNDLSHNVSLATGQRVRIPGSKSADRIASEDSFEPAEEVSDPYTDSESSSAKDDYNQQDSPEIAYAPPEDEATTLDDVEEQTDAESMEEEAGNFRWPVKGRIISKYGAKPGGTRNEGINIAVPEGTSVRAAQSGVIAYAGNELKGYGNLILIRHQDGWVTAYAHNKQLFVKRGDTVKRGDIIAKAGQTGSVESPQLHFELRKGATAVDPMKYLVSSQAANY